MRLRSPWRTAILCAAAQTVLAASTGQADTIFWANSQGGDFGNPNNWYPVGPPGPGDTADFNQGEWYSVNLDLNPSTNILSVTDHVTFLNSAPGRTYTVASLLDVTFGVGSLTIAPAVPMTLNAQDASIYGTLNVGAGSDVHIANDMIVSTGSGSSTVIVDGAGTTLNALYDVVIGTSPGTTGLVRYDHDASGVVGLLWIGANQSAGGSGTLNIFNGADLTANAAVRVGTAGFAGQTGMISISGAGSTLTQNTVSFFAIGAAANSTGTLLVSNGGVFTMGNASLIINKTGTLDVNSSATANLGGPIAVSGGLLKVNGGTLNWASGKTLTANSGAQLQISSLTMPASSTINLSGGATYTGNGILIGYTNTANMTVSGAGTAMNLTGSAQVGGGTGAPGGVGTLTISNNATASFGSLNIGQAVAGSGNGAVNIQSGAIVTSGNIYIATANLLPGTTGGLTVTGAGSYLLQDGASTLSVGGGSNSSGTVNITAGGNLWTGSGLTSVQKLGVINLDPGSDTSGLLVLGDILVNGGRIQQSSGYFNWGGHQMDITNGGDVILTPFQLLDRVINVSGAGSTFAPHSLLLRNGSLNLLSGGSCSTLYVHMGDYNANDSVLVDGVNSSLTTNIVWLGRFGAGYMEFANEATGTVGQLDIASAGANPNSWGMLLVHNGADLTLTHWLKMAPEGVGTAYVYVSDAGSTLTMDNGSDVVEHQIGSPSGGTALITVKDGASIAVNSPIATMTINPTGAVNVSNANASFHNLVNRGFLYFTRTVPGGGSLSIANLSIGDESLFRTNTVDPLTIGANVTLQGNGMVQVSNGELILSGPFTIPAGGRNLLKFGTGSLSLQSNAPWTTSTGVSTLLVSEGTLNLDVTPNTLVNIDIVNYDTLNIRDAIGGIPGSGGTRHIRNLSGPGVTNIFPASKLVANYVRQSTLTIMGQLQLRQNGGSGNIGTLVMNPGSSMDLADNKFVTNSSPGTSTGSTYTGMQGLVQMGRNSGAWNGNGIRTSLNDALTNFTSIGVATGAQVRRLWGTETDVWAGQTINANSTLVMYTYGGDATLDGQINIDDYVRIDQGIAAGWSGWFNGDFNYDGKINIDDYTQFIDANIGNQGAPFSTGAGVETLSVTVVPEPAALGLAVAAATLARRRRWRGSAGVRKNAGLASVNAVMMCKRSRTSN